MRSYSLLFLVPVPSVQIKESPLNSMKLNEPDYGKQIPISILMKAYWRALPQLMLWAMMLLLAGVLVKTIFLNKCPASADLIYELGFVFEQMLYGLLGGVLFYLASVHVETAKQEVLHDFTLLQVGLIALRYVKQIKLMLGISKDSSIYKIGCLSREEVEDVLKPLRWDEDTVSSKRFLFLIQHIRSNCYDQLKSDYIVEEEDLSFHPLNKYRRLLRGLGNNAAALNQLLTHFDKSGLLKGSNLNRFLFIPNSTTTIFTLFESADELAIYMKSEFGYLFLPSPLWRCSKQN